MRPTLNADELAIAQSAITTSRLLFETSSSPESDIPELSTADLLAFCALKGVALNFNIWNRRALLEKARTYFNEELLARLKTGLAWEQIPSKRKVRLMHVVCNGEGEATYVDPDSGYTVFSAFAHLKRGHCCGVQRDDDGVVTRTHRCRHCPYTETGEIGGAAMQALLERLHVIEYVRSAIQAGWHKKSGAASFGFSRNPIESPSKSHVGTDEDKRKLEERGGVLTGLVDEDPENIARLRRKLVKRIKMEHSKKSSPACDICKDEKMMTCPRCNGWTHVISPKFQECPRCKGEGMHPCVKCTPFRPPPTTSIYS